MNEIIPIEVDFNMIDDGSYIGLTETELKPGTLVKAYDVEGLEMLAVVHKTDDRGVVWVRGLPALHISTGQSQPIDGFVSDGFLFDVASARIKNDPAPSLINS